LEFFATRPVASNPLAGGQAMYGAERLAKYQNFAGQLGATLLAKGAGFEIYSVGVQQLRCLDGSRRIRQVPGAKVSTAARRRRNPA
jgi:hypothetical protein